MLEKHANCTLLSHEHMFYQAKMCGTNQIPWVIQVNAYLYSETNKKVVPFSFLLLQFIMMKFFAHCHHSTQHIVQDGYCDWISAVSGALADCSYCADYSDPTKGLAKTLCHMLTAMIKPPMKDWPLLFRWNLLQAQFKFCASCAAHSPTWPQTKQSWITVTSKCGLHWLCNSVVSQLST